ncbi:MAG: glycosyltransferase [Holophagales bacterium]|nr:glycosyltransferase [Holophagales bacterium]
MDAAQPSPRVSVILRTKDRPDLLAEALASLRAQTFADFETVLVNDGGPLPEALLAPAPGRGLRVVVPPAPGGRTRALNAGLAAARGGWVAYLDDDDVYLPGHLAALEAARAAGARAAHTSVRQTRQERGADGSFHDGATITTYDRPLDAGRILLKNDVPLLALGHERALADAAGGFDPAFDLFEDWDFLIRLSRLVPVAHVPEVTAVYRVRAGSNVTETTPWGSPAAEAARRRLYAKHAAAVTPEAMVAFVDGVVGDLEAALGRESFLVGEYARAEAEANGARAALDAQAARAARLESELAATREDASRFREESATREQSLAVQNSHLHADLAKRDATLEAIYRSRVWRFFTPWWRLRERLRK